MDIVMLLSMGALAGTLAGLLGIGGGIIIVPVLALVFQHQHVDPGVLMHVAIGTSLGTIVITSLSSIRAHHRRGAIQWPVFRLITPGILVGGLIGAAIADQLSGATLRTAFALFMLLVAAQMMLGNASKPHRQLPKRFGLLLAGLVIGTVSALMG
ncbi:MAG: sulfite exporter TauE/SafE family protein, partial [Gammaproteobacteria bacterium]